MIKKEPATEHATCQVTWIANYFVSCRGACDFATCSHGQKGNTCIILEFFKWVLYIAKIIMHFVSASIHAEYHIHRNLTWCECRRKRKKKIERKKKKLKSSLVAGLKILPRKMRLLHEGLFLAVGLSLTFRWCPTFWGWIWSLLHALVPCAGKRWFYL